MEGIFQNAKPQVHIISQKEFQKCSELGKTRWSKGVE